MHGATCWTHQSWRINWRVFAASGSIKSSAARHRTRTRPGPPKKRVVPLLLCSRKSSSPRLFCPGARAHYHRPCKRERTHRPPFQVCRTSCPRTQRRHKHPWIVLPWIVSKQSGGLQRARAFKRTCYALGGDARKGSRSKLPACARALGRQPPDCSLTGTRYASASKEACVCRRGRTHKLLLLRLHNTDTAREVGGD